MPYFISKYRFIASKMQLFLLDQNTVTLYYFEIHSNFTFFVISITYSVPFICNPKIQTCIKRHPNNIYLPKSSINKFGCAVS